MGITLVGGLIAAILLASEPAAGARNDAAYRDAPKEVARAASCGTPQKCLDFFVERQTLLRDVQKLKAQLETLLETGAPELKEEWRAYIYRCDKIIQALTVRPRYLPY